MKKVFKYVFVLFVLFCSLQRVKADDVFNKDWDAFSQSFPVEQYELAIYTKVAAPFRNGYVLSNMDLEKYRAEEGLLGYLNFYNYEGNLISSVEYDDGIVLDIETNDEYVIVLLFSFDESDPNTVYRIVKYDKELKEQKRISINLSDEISQYFISDSKLYNIDKLRIHENSIYIFNDSYSVLEFDFDLNQVSQNSFEQGNINDPLCSVFYDFCLLEQGQVDGRMNYSYDKKDDMELFSGSLNETESSLGDGAFLKYVKDGEVVFDKKYEEYYFLFTARFANDYIVAAAEKETEGNFSSIEILILDLEGNILQKIDSSDAYITVYENNASFIVLALDFEQACSYDESLVCNDFKYEYYYLPLKISTKVEGEGIVDVVTNSRNGETITFKVNPEKGYVLNSTNIKTTDGIVNLDGDNTFTMPTSDVTIEAVFVVNNPNTSVFVKVGMAALLCFSVFMVIIFRYVRLRKYSN